MFYNLCQVRDESSQKVYFSKEGLQFLLTAWSANFQDLFNPDGVYLDALFRDNVPQQLPFFHPEM